MPQIIIQTHELIILILSIVIGIALVEVLRESVRKLFRPNEKVYVSIKSCEGFRAQCQGVFCDDLKVIRSVVLRLAVKQGIPIEDFERLAE